MAEGLKEKKNCVRFRQTKLYYNLGKHQVKKMEATLV